MKTTSPQQTQYDVLEETMAHRPGLLRILVIDLTFPEDTQLYTMPLDLRDEDTFQAQRKLPISQNWLEELRRSIKLKDDDWKLKLRGKALGEWFPAHQRPVIKAALSAMHIYQDSSPAGTWLTL